MFCGGFKQTAVAFVPELKRRLPPRFRRIATNPVTADGAFSALVDIFSNTDCAVAAPALRSVSPHAGFHQTYQFIGYAINNNQYLSFGTNDVVIERSAFDDGLSSTARVGGFIHHYRRGCQRLRQSDVYCVFTRRFYYRFRRRSPPKKADARNLNKRCAVSISGFATVTSKFFRPACGNNRLVEQRNRPLGRFLFSPPDVGKMTLLPAAIRLMALLMTVAAG